MRLALQPAAYKCPEACVDIHGALIKGLPTGNKGLPRIPTGIEGIPCTSEEA